MSQMTSDEVIDRIHSLERSLRRARVVLAVAALGVVCAMTVGFAQTAAEKTVRANRFILVDETGKERAVLGFGEKSVGLFLYARNPTQSKTPLASFALHHHGESDSEQPRAEFQFGQLTTSVSAFGINLNNEEAQGGIQLSYLNGPSLAFHDRSGMPYVNLSYNEKSGTRFEIMTPLGIKGAFDELSKTALSKEDPDPLISDALYRSRRIEICAPPFADPYVNLFKDGRLLSTPK